MMKDKAIRKVLLLVENAPIPGDPRVWNEAVTLRDAGYQVCIIAPLHAVQPLQYACSCVEGLFIYRFKQFEAQNKYLAYLFEYCCAFWRMFLLSLKVWRRHGFDVIHVANPPDLFFLLGLFYRCFAKKFVFDQHDLAPELFKVIFQGRARLLYWLLCLLECCSYRLAHLVIVTNESFLSRACKRGGCAPEKVFVVRNGPNLMHYKPYEPAAELYFPTQKSYVLAYVGVMGKQDGVENALYALHHLVYIYGRSDVSAVFIGSGSMLSELQRLAQRLKLAEYTYFPGWLGMQDVVRYLAIADVGLVPDPQNGLNEFCPMLKVMEYMTAGLPVVAFDLLETRVSAEGAALYAKPNEIADFARQIALLLNSEELRGSMGVAGRKRIVEVLSWEHSRPNLLAAYETLFQVDR
jgi:glycosyltransferase involved in cell wall biosynthesis